MWYTLGFKEKLGVVSLVGVVLGTAGWLGYSRMVWGPPATAHGVEAIPGERFPVYVTGAVRKPSVIRAHSGMLVQEALEAAGGPSRGADLKRLNLAARLTPNSRVYVPEAGEEVDADELGPYGPSAAASSAGSSGTAAGGRVNLNTAGEAELDRLPGVGPATARKILEYRAAVGRFRTVDELLEVKGIGPKKMEQIRPLATVD